MTNEEREQLARELDGFMMSALSIYDVSKVMPHPYDAVASMANKWAHDFVGFAFSLQNRLDTINTAPAGEMTDTWFYRKQIEQTVERMSVGVVEGGVMAPSAEPQTLECLRAGRRAAEDALALATEKIDLHYGAKMVCIKSPLPNGEFNWEHRWICSGLNCDCPECPTPEKEVR